MNNHPLREADLRHLRHDEHRQGRRSAPASSSATRAPVGTTYQPVPAPASNPPDANFPAGSGRGTGTRRSRSRTTSSRTASAPTTCRRGRARRAASSTGRPRQSTITAARKATNKIAMDNQEDIVNFQTIFNGPWPFTTDGVVVGTPSASFEEEMQGEDHLRRRHDRRHDGHVARHVQPREHAPVVRRQRRRGRVQPDVLEGGLRHARRVPRHRAHAPRPPPAGSTRPDAAFETSLDQPVQRHGQLQHDERDVLDDGAVEPDGRQPVHDREHVHAAGHRLRRAVAARSAATG